MSLSVNNITSSVKGNLNKKIKEVDDTEMKIFDIWPSNGSFKYTQHSYSQDVVYYAYRSN